ncbi:MAG: hypothetical protein PF692_01715 [Kiritimatiellae bacterium]|jgi:hypothetical protein|nr:hypothetical protein [Kiritimatiellia bacterium]
MTVLMGGMYVAVMLLIFFAVVFILIWPLQISAKMIEAKRTGFGSCLLAVLAANVLSTIVFFALPQLAVIALLANVIITAFVFAGVLGTTFIKAVAITIVYWVLLVAVLFLAFFVVSLFGIGLAMPFV